jgi:hypothetical protein
VDDRAETFEPLIGDSFEVIAADDRSHLELLSVERFESSGPRSEAFSLLFIGPAGSQLGQGTYRFEHEGAGMEIFIVPVQPTPDGRPRYEAVFN